MAEPIRILYVDDYPLDRELVRDALEREDGGFRVSEARARADFEAQLANGEFDLVLSDFNILGFEGLQVLDAVHAKDPHLPVIIVTGTGSEQIAVEAMKRGAADYVIKTPKHIQRLPVTIHAVLAKKQLEQEHARSDARFRAVVESGWIGVALFDRQGGLLYYSPSMERITGYAFEQAATLSLEDLIHPDERETAQAQAAQLLATPDGVIISEYRVRHKNGAWIWLEFASQNLLDDPRVQAVVSTARDITARKLHERELQAIVTVAAALRRAGTRREMMAVLLEQVGALLDAGGAALTMRDPDRQETFIEVGRGEWESAAQVRLTQGQGIGAHVIATGQPFLDNDALQDPRLLHRELLGACNAVAAVPLTAGEQTLGALWIVRANEIVESEVRLLTAIADMAANAIHRSTLYEQTERQVQRLAALHTIDTAISGSMDLDITLKVLLEQVTSQLNVDAAAVLLLQPHLNTLEFAAARGFRGSGITRLRLKLGEDYAGQAALERRRIYVPDLTWAERAFTQPGLTAGEEFVSFYAVPLIAKGRVKGVLEVFHRQPLRPDREWLDFLETLAGQAAIAIDDAEMFHNLQRSNLELGLAYDTTIEGWSRALDLRDKETEGHTRRVTEMTLRLARAFGMSDAELIHVRRGALLHDIGKMGIADSVLLKPAPLTEEEWVLMRKHPQYAYEMLSPIAYLKLALDIPYCHHEKWDGTGYPRGLKGEQIPLAARIFAVVDVWDALRSDRPYRRAWSPEQVRAHVRSLAGTHFDPRVVEVFIQVMDSNVE